MKCRTDIQFRSDFPDDSVEEEDEIVVWPGRNVMEMLKASFDALGYRVAEPLHVPGRGWDLDLVRGGDIFRIRINTFGPEDNYLMVGEFAMWLWQCKYRYFLTDLDCTLKADQRVHDVRWYPAGKAQQDIKPWAGPFGD